MGKKKKAKVKIVYRDAPKPVQPTVIDVETDPEPVEPKIELTPERQQAAVKRLTDMLKALSEKPEPIKDMLYRLEIPWERVQNVPGDPSHDTIVIRSVDLDAGEERHQALGSIAQRIWGDMAAEHLKNNPVPEKEPEVEVIQPNSMAGLGLPDAKQFEDLIKRLREG